MACSNLNFRYKVEYDLQYQEEAAFPMELNEALRILPHVKVALQGVRLRERRSVPPAYLQTLPFANIISFDGEVDTHWNKSEEEFAAVHPNIKAFFAAATNLESLKLSSNGAWRFYTEGNRLPAVKELKLREYEFDLPVSSVSQIWDFSKLESLSLIYSTIWDRRGGGGFLEIFFRCVKPHQLPLLRKFVCTNDVGRNVGEQRRSTELLGHFLQPLIHLEDLRIIGIGSDILPYISGYVHKLKVLKMPISQNAYIDIHHIANVLGSSCMFEELHISCGQVADLVSTFYHFPKSFYTLGR